MTRLDQTIRKNSKIVEKELDRKIKKRLKDGYVFTWNGKKIVSLEKWQELEKCTGQNTMLEYVPDTLLVPVFSSPADNDTIKEKRNAWVNSYIDFLEERRDPLFGKHLCKECILSGNNSQNKAIRDFLLKTVKDSDGKPVGNTCDVVNIFKCPYKQGVKDRDLFELETVRSMVEGALQHAKELSENNGRTYEVDFEKGQARGNINLGFGFTSWHPISGMLDGLVLSEITVQNASDVYGILYDRKSLETILDQYVSQVTKDQADKDRAQQMQITKKAALDILGKMSDKIKPEDLFEFDDKGTDEKRSIYAGLVPENKTGKDMEASGKICSVCVTCGKFSNIRCTNCDMWVCIHHWREHGLQVHHMKS